MSVASAQHVASILPKARCWFWAPAGEVYEVKREVLLKHERAFERELSPTTAPTWTGMQAALADIGKSAVFLALHGVGGEDGRIQAWLEAQEVLFTGSSAAASRAAFDKTVAKRIVSKAGVRVAKADVLSGRNTAHSEAAIRGMWERYGRIVVKPVADGSSHGLCVVDDESSFRRAVDQVSAMPEQTWLLEEFITGREITVGVIDAEQGLVALPASEVILDRGRRFDYEGKYLGRGTKEVTPADLDDRTREAVCEVAKSAHASIGCRGYSRIDMIVDARGPVFLEINNLPGLTKSSFIPQQLAAAGIPMADFVTRQLELAKHRYDEPAKRRKPGLSRASRSRHAED
ncbi:MAG: ATP-grasp domain-containing protein [Deltaproteobacteria bacterium]|nr:ATP-grasp domain-containing protein [Deltaproteobacteria bacterium]